MTLFVPSIISVCDRNILSAPLCKVMQFVVIDLCAKIRLFVFRFCCESGSLAPNVVRATIID